MIVINLTIEGGIAYARDRDGTTRHDIDEDTKLYGLIAAHRRKARVKKEAGWFHFTPDTSPSAIGKN